MDRDKVVLLFGAMPDGRDPAEPEDRAALLAETHRIEERGDSARLWEATRDVVAQQILADDPPEVWQVAQRLAAEGLDGPAVVRQLVIALLPVLIDPLGSGELLGGEVDRAEYAERLARLPLPTPEQLIAALCEVARERGPLPVGELDLLAAERLGISPVDDVIQDLLDEAGDGIMDLDGPLAMFPGEVVAHVGSLTAAIVLTHRLSEAERRSGTLEVGVDLAAFRRRAGLQDASGGRIDVEADEAGILAWVGSETWLAGFPAEALLGVRIDPGDVVRLDVLAAEPEPDGLVELCRRVYHDAWVEPGLAVEAEELLLGMLVARADAFGHPRPPLRVLTEHAGLERRDSRFAHEESVWQEEALAVQQLRVLDRLEDEDATWSALSALEVLQQDSLDVSAARHALSELADPEILEVVADELLGLLDEPEHVRRLTALSAQLLRAARTGEGQAVAHWLGAVAAERRGDVLEGESHLRAAVRADPGWPCAQDRLAWYEADRGDAPAALARWRALGIPDDLDDPRTVRPFAETATPAPGRNEACWCGSGRKFKACHRGRPALGALPDRVGWLRRKSIAYLERRGGAPGPVVASYAAAARRPELSDEPWLSEAMHDPLLLDVVLHEGGWFARFLADRGPLLPADEALLARGWTQVQRSVYEILEVDIGSGAGVRDLRTGEHLRVRACTSGQGQLVCGRALPDGESHQFLCGLLDAAPGTEPELLDVLAAGDGLRFLAYVRDAGLGVRYGQLTHSSVPSSNT